MLLVTRNTRDFDGTSPSVRVPYASSWSPQHSAKKGPRPGFWR